MHNYRTLTHCIATGMFTGFAVVLAAACASSAPRARVPNEASAAIFSPSTSAAVSVVQDDLNGTYTIRYTVGDEKTWTVVSCGRGCVNVVQKPSQPQASETVYGLAQLSGTTWVLSIQRPDAVVCPDGGRYDGKTTWTWDAKTLEGSMTLLQFRDDCGDGMAPSPPHPFTLRKESENILPLGRQGS
jgi:hypothetical protein